MTRAFVPLIAILVAIALVLIAAALIGGQLSAEHGGWPKLHRELSR